jgi:uncharacterized protein YwqG
VADRRGFFKELLREVAGIAQELSAVAQSVEEPEPWSPPPPVPAQPATAGVDADALLGLCREVGLEKRSDDVRRAVRASVRLTPAAGGSRSRLGGSPDVPRGFAWPTWNGRELAFLGQVDVAEAIAVDPELPLPREGLLLFFYDLAERPSGLSPSHRGSCRAVLVEDRKLEPDESRTPALRPQPVELSRELMLPSAWSFRAEQLELGADEMDAWETLRERVAQAQGVELEEQIPDRLALHRLLGYQDEIGREVELDCQLASSGLDADDVSVYWESRSEHEEEARRWRLLLQLSADDALETPREGFDRLFICVRDGDDLDGAWAILR